MPFSKVSVGHLDEEAQRISILALNPLIHWAKQPVARILLSIQRRLAKAKRKSVGQGPRGRMYRRFSDHRRVRDRMFTKRMLGVAVAVAVMGAAGAVNASPSLQIVTSFPTAGLEHTADPGGSVYPYPGGFGPGAGIPWRSPTGAGWPNGPGMGPDVGPPGFPGVGTSGWHGSYLQLVGAQSALISFEFMGAGNSSFPNSFWVNPTGDVNAGWFPLFNDGQSSGPTAPCPVSGTAPDCNILAGGYPNVNEWTIEMTADANGYLLFAFDIGNGPGAPPIRQGGPINQPGAAWNWAGLNPAYQGCTGSPDTSFPNECAGFFLGADPYLVNANHVSTGLQAVYAGLTDLPCVGGACDHDFQDMGVRISVVPEPGTLALLGIALSGLAVARKRRSAKA